jgi:hypothetical protein
VQLELKTPRFDDATHLSLIASELIERLVAIHLVYLLRVRAWR